MSFRFLSCWVIGTLAVSTGVQAVPLDLRMEHDAAGSPFRPGPVEYQTQAGERYSITRASYLLSGFALRDLRGDWQELEGVVAWMDAAKGRTATSLGEVPSGSYTMIRFAVGLDAQTNGLPPARIPAGHPLDPTLNGLHWSWQGGFIFLALEGAWAPSENAAYRGFSYHLGRNENRTLVVLKADFEASGTDPLLLRIGFHLGKILDGPRPISLERDGFSTHSQPGDPLAESIVANLPGAFSWRGAATATKPGSPPQPGTGLPKIPGEGTPGLTRWEGAFPPPVHRIAADRAAIELGRRLFHEGALSRNGEISCASCHPQETAFADPRRFSLGVDGQPGSRHSMPLFNLAWKRDFFWDGRVSTLREQALLPIQDPTEMDETLENVVRKLEKAGYGSLFSAAYPSGEISPERIGSALESFLLTLTSHDSKFDRAMRGEVRLTDEEERGFILFMTERDPRLGIEGADCFHCHGGALFTDHQYRNNGLAIHETDLGRYRVTGSALDRGLFATPSLRNIALTAPYMHDGRFGTLEEVLDHYSHGVQRTDTLDPNLAKHPEGGLHLNASEKTAVIAFLKTLSDPRYGNPPGPPSRGSPGAR